MTFKKAIMKKFMDQIIKFYPKNRRAFEHAL